MTTPNSKLVPTEIVNKNGVLTTVYRKPAKVAAKADRLPPPASAHLSTRNHAEWINERLTKTESVGDEHMLNACKSLFINELGELSQRLLSSGTITGQKLVADSLSDTVSNLAVYFERSGTTSMKIESLNTGLTCGEITRKWNYGNVREEGNLSPDEITQEDLSHLHFTHSFLTMYESSYDSIPEEAHRTMTKEVETHWRGTAALSLCFAFGDDAEVADDQWEKFDAFIPWAALRNDIGAVIRAAKQHGTIDPSSLENIMEGEAAGVHGSMIDGWV